MAPESTASEVEHDEPEHKQGNDREEYLLTQREAVSLHKSGRHLVLCGMRDQPAKLMAQAQFHRYIGDANIVPTLADGVARAKSLLKRDSGNI